MKDTRTAYLIFVRPPGSQMWTQHTKHFDGAPIPWTSYKLADAEQEAMRVMRLKSYCTRVVPIEHPKEVDTNLYSQMADGDIRFYPACS